MESSNQIDFADVSKEDASLLRTTGTTFKVDGDRLFCEVLQYHPNTNAVEFCVYNGDWEGTLLLDTKQVYVHATKQYYIYNTITDIKPPKQCWQDDIPFTMHWGTKSLKM